MWLSPSPTHAQRCRLVLKHSPPTFLIHIGLSKIPGVGKELANRQLGFVQGWLEIALVGLVERSAGLLAETLA